MRLHSIILRGTTDGDGDATINAALPTHGLLYAVQWIDGTFDNGVDGVLSVQNTQAGVAVTHLTLTDENDDDWFFPREDVHDNAGGALTGTAGGDRTMPVIDGVLRLVIAQGGDTKEGGAIVWVLE